MKKKTKQILAIIAIVLLVAMYVINLILALIGSPAAKNLLKATMVLTVLIPILLYAMLLLMGRAPGGKRDDSETLSYEEREELRRRMREGLPSEPTGPQKSEENRSEH